VCCVEGPGFFGPFFCLSNNPTAEGFTPTVLPTRIVGREAFLMEVFLMKILDYNNNVE